MKIKPVINYKTPSYPTIKIVDCDPSLLCRLPRRWKKTSSFSALLGMGILSRTLLSGSLMASPSGVEAPIQVESVEDDSLQNEIAKTKAVVAPMLAEAMANDGRGSFGCIAVNPPTFLSESEALELIQKELKTAGFDVERNKSLDRVIAPSLTHKGYEIVYENNRARFKNLKEIPLEPRNYLFDFADKKQTIFIQYLSLSDYRKWMGQPMSTAQSCDFPKLVDKITDAFSQRTSEKPVVFGLFFDPAVKRQNITLFLVARTKTGLTKKHWDMVLEEMKRSRKADNEAIKDESLNKLRRQVQHFIEYLKKEGHIEKQTKITSETNHASDSSSDGSV